VAISHRMARLVIIGADDDKKIYDFDTMRMSACYDRGKWYQLYRRNVTRNVKLTQVAKNHFAFATALLWHYSFEIT
jgi:hypothetical protein